MKDLLQQLLFCFVYALLVLAAVDGALKSIGMIPKNSGGLVSWFPVCLCNSAKLLILFVVNTLMLCLRLIANVMHPNRIPDEFAHYVERMTDAVVRPYS